MPSILKREFAPISDQAWSELDTEASRVIRQTLAGRKVVDFVGPHGWELAAVNLGRLKIASKAGPGGIDWGTREVLPLIEVRVPFKLKQIEIDNVTRGSEDADIDPMLDVAANVAKFEDTAIFQGFKEANIPGVLASSEHKARKLPKDPEGYPAVIADAVKAMAGSGIEGPYATVLGPDAYYSLMQSAKTGYPPSKIVQEITGGDILLSPVLKGGVIMSTRGGDFELTVGKDFSIGYASHDRETVEFFLTESFTFRTLEPKAAVALNVATR